MTRQMQNSNLNGQYICEKICHLISSQEECNLKKGSEICLQIGQHFKINNYWYSEEPVEMDTLINPLPLSSTLAILTSPATLASLLFLVHAGYLSISVISLAVASTWNPPPSDIQITPVLPSGFSQRLPFQQGTFSFKYATSPYHSSYLLTCFIFLHKLDRWQVGK